MNSCLFFFFSLFFRFCHPCSQVKVVIRVTKNMTAAVVVSMTLKKIGRGLFVYLSFIFKKIIITNLFLFDFKGAQSLDTANFVLVETSSRDTKSSVIANDSYPLQIVSSASYNAAHDIYLCPVERAGGRVHLFLQEFQPDFYFFLFFPQQTGDIHAFIAEKTKEQDEALLKTALSLATAAGVETVSVLPTRTWEFAIYFCVLCKSKIIN